MPLRLYYRHFLEFACLLVLFMGAAWAQQPPRNPPLHFGIVPFNSTSALFRIHRPLGEHLSVALKRPVRFYTASDHAAFYRDAAENNFDMMIVSPHFVPLLMNKGYVPLARYRSGFDIMLVLRKETYYGKVEDLRGKTIGFPDRVSFQTINALLWFEQHGFVSGQDFKVQMLPSHAAAVQAVSLGQLDMAVTAGTAFNQVPEDVRAKLKTVRLNSMPQTSLFFMAKGTPGSAEIARLKSMLFAFPSTPSGKAFFQQTGYIGLADVTEQDLQTISVYTRITENILNQPSTLFVDETRKIVRKNVDSSS